MCNKGHTFGVQQGGKEDNESLRGDSAGKCFQRNVSFVLKVWEEELTKWTTGETGQSILVEPQVGIPGKQGVPGDLSPSTVSDWRRPS